MDVGLSFSSFCSSYFPQCVHVCVCVCVSVSYQTPGGRLFVSEMSDQDGEISRVCLTHGGQHNSVITQCADQHEAWSEL